ncbi:hypothetical protein ACLMJK_009421 [Lecanora helva]
MACSKVDDPVENALPPSVLAFQDQLKQNLQSLKSRREKLTACEILIQKSVAGIEEKQLHLQVARDIVIEQRLFADAWNSVKEWEDSLGIERQQLDVSKTHRANVERATKQFHRHTKTWPWDVLRRDQHPTLWSRAILQGLAILAGLCPMVEDITSELEERIRDRSGRRTPKRGLSKSDKLVSADVHAAINSKKQTVPNDKAGNKVSKKRGKGNQEDSGPPKRQAKAVAVKGAKPAKSGNDVTKPITAQQRATHPKRNGQKTGAIRNGKVSVTATPEEDLISEDTEDEMESMQGDRAADNRGTAGSGETVTSEDEASPGSRAGEIDPFIGIAGKMQATPTSINRTTINHPTSQEYVFQEAHNRTPTGGGLPTPRTSAMRTTLPALEHNSRPFLASPQNTPHKPEGFPTPGESPISQGSPTPRPCDQTSLEIYGLSNMDPVDSPSEIHQSLAVAKKHSGLVDEAAKAFRESQQGSQEVEQHLRDITAAQEEVECRIGHCKALLQPPKKIIPEIEKGLMLAIQVTASPYRILLNQRYKLINIKTMAVNLLEKRVLRAKALAVTYAWVRSQQH